MVALVQSVDHLLSALVVIVIPNALTLVATHSVADFLLLTLALVVTDDAFVAPTVAAVMTLIGASALLAAILAVIGVGVRGDLAETKQGRQ